MEKERKKVYVSLTVLLVILFVLLFWLFRATTPVASADTIFYGYGPGYAFGFYGYSYSRDQVHWSIYEHKLVSGDVYYSPYAFNYGHSGLVNKEFYYSPYAFGTGQSGLVSRYDARPYCPNPVVVVQSNPSFDQIFKQETEQQKRYQENVEARRKKVEQRKRERQKSR